MESNWRYAVPMMGVSGWGDKQALGFEPGSFNALKIAELIFPIVVLGFVHTHIIQANVVGLGLRWKPFGLLLGYPFGSMFNWQPEFGHFPYGLWVHPD